MSDTKVLALVLLTVFSAFIFQWCYFSSVNSDGGLIWVSDIKEEDMYGKIDIDEEMVGVGEKLESGVVVKGEEHVETAPPWYKIWESVPYAFKKAGEAAKGVGAKIISPFTTAWDWIERTHIFDIATFNVWEGINVEVPKGIQYTFSLIMGIIIYAIPAYLIVKLIRGGG